MGILTGFRDSREQLHTNVVGNYYAGVCAEFQRILGYPPFLADIFSFWAGAPPPLYGGGGAQKPKIATTFGSTILNMCLTTSL